MFAEAVARIGPGLALRRLVNFKSLTSQGDGVQHRQQLK